MPSLLKQFTSAPPRIEQTELLDQGKGTAEEVRQNLRDMHSVNRWLGGHAALRRFLLPRLRQAAGSTPLRILDVGSGAAHTPLTLAKWARRRGIPLHIVALDANHSLLGMAAHQLAGYPEISRLSADARNLPFAPGSFDFVISTHFLHHLSPAELIPTLGMIARVSRGPVILNDLVRSSTAAFLFRRGAPWIFQNRLTLHDGQASIAQSYTPSEMREMLRAAGLARASVHAHRLYHRMTVVIETDGEDPAS